MLRMTSSPATLSTSVARMIAQETLPTGYLRWVVLAWETITRSGPALTRISAPGWPSVSVAPKTDQTTLPKL